MDNSSLTGAPSLGARVRELRMRHGVKQAELAARLDISPSYLNLIEHDRRRIGQDMIVRIAQALEVEETVLSATVDPDLIERLIKSAANDGANAEINEAADLGVRFPGWAALVASQADRIEELELRLQEIGDRLTYDPTLSASLHKILTAATSIRSTASILNSDEELDQDWQDRFQKNIHQDAIALGENSEALVKMLRSPSEDEKFISPLREVEGFLAAKGFHLKELEGENPDVSDFVANARVSTGAVEILLRFALQYVEDARLLPLKQFAAAAQKYSYDPGVLGAHFEAPLMPVLRRLATLPPAKGQPNFGLLQIDGFGSFGICKDLTGMIFPRSGTSPFAPIYKAMAQPGHAVRAYLALPDEPDRIVHCVTLAETGARLPHRPPMVRATALLIEGGPQTSGMACRVCMDAQESFDIP